VVDLVVVIEYDGFGGYGECVDVDFGGVGLWL